MWVCCTQYAHVVDENLSQLGQEVRSHRASKLKKSDFYGFSKIEKNRFLQVTKVDLSPQRGKILGPNLSYQHITKMHCSHLNIFGKIHLFWEIGDVKVRPWFWSGVPKFSTPNTFLKTWISAPRQGLGDPTWYIV
jgi:hypothetical protein